MYACCTERCAGSPHVCWAEAQALGFRFGGDVLFGTPLRGRSAETVPPTVPSPPDRRVARARVRPPGAPRRVRFRTRSRRPLPGPARDGERRAGALRVADLVG